jgi:threonine synthase
MLTFVCAGCGATLPAGGSNARPFRCPNARDGDDIDHVLRCGCPPSAPFPEGDEENPFILYRSLLAAHALALDAGLGDEAFTHLVHELDDAVARVD